MTCAICFDPIIPGQRVNEHHEVYKCRGGKTTTPVHKDCHVKLHGTRGDFREFGRIGGQISALDKHWAFTLKGVKDSPLYEQARAFNRAMYAK
jgi:hypothetical protein